MTYSFSDEGIVLRRVNYGEADRILTVLTREHGKIGVIARGVRKAKSKLAAHTDIFARAQLQLVKGRGDLYTLTGANHLDPHLQWNEPVNAVCASVCAELADRVLEADHPLEPDLYQLVVSSIQECANSLYDPRLAMAWMGQQMISRLGYTPELQLCAACGRTLPGGDLNFNFLSGGLVCAQCGLNILGTVDCSAAVVKALRTIAVSDSSALRSLELDDQALNGLEQIVELELAHHLERQLRSFKVLRDLVPVFSGTG